MKQLDVAADSMEASDPKSAARPASTDSAAETAKQIRALNKKVRVCNLWMHLQESESIRPSALSQHAWHGFVFDLNCSRSVRQLISHCSRVQARIKTGWNAPGQFLPRSQLRMTT